MFLTKKYLVSFLIIISLGILQFNIVAGIKPAQADSTLFNNQSLLKDSASPSYGNAPKDVKVIALTMLNTVLKFLALLTVILMLVAGFNYMTSGGNDEKIKKSMGQIQALAIGLVIIMSSWGITYYLLKASICVTTTSTPCPLTFW